MNDREIKIKLLYREMPEKVKAATAQIGPDEYKTIINSTLDEEERAAAFLHECTHILNRDHLKTEPVQEIEAKLHEQLKGIAENYLRNDKGPK